MPKYMLLRTNWLQLQHESFIMTLSYVLETLKGFFMIRLNNLKTSSLAILIRPLEHQDLTLGNVDCIQHFPNNISSLLGTTIRNNDANQNIVGSLNYFVPQSQPQPHPLYYQYYMPDSQSYTVSGWQLYWFNLWVLYFIYQLSLLFCFMLNSTLTLSKCSSGSRIVT